MPLNDRQTRFCEAYIANGGNATQAAIAAGYSAKAARSIASENLTKPDIVEYIKNRTQPTDARRIATADEVLEYLSAVLRRELCESVVVMTKRTESGIDSRGKKFTRTTETPEVVQIPAKLVDANRAAELLGKYMMLWDGQGKQRQSNGILESLLSIMEKKHDG